MNRQNEMLLKIADLEQRVLNELVHEEIATELALLSIANAVVLVALELREMNERGELEDERKGWSN